MERPRLEKAAWMCQTYRDLLVSPIDRLQCHDLLMVNLQNLLSLIMASHLKEMKVCRMPPLEAIST
jgi:hypothetical protein